MNDNDLVMREDVENARTEILRTLNYINLNGALYYTVYIELFDEIKRQFDGIHSVPQEISAVEYEKALWRMHESRPFCSELKQYMEIFDTRFDDPLAIEKAVAIIEKWAREHPERSEE